VNSEQNKIFASSVETVLSDPELAKKVIEAIEKGLYSIEEKAKEQKVIIKTELKDELTKELVAKDELKATEERLRTEIHKWRADTIKWMFIFWLGQIATFTGILVSVLKLMLK